MVHVIQEEEVELSIARLDELGPEPSHEGGRAEEKSKEQEELTVMAETLQSAHNFLTCTVYYSDFELQECCSDCCLQT